MDWRQIEHIWEELAGDAKSQWSRLTDDDLKLIAGKLDRLVGKVVERYGVTRELAHRDATDWAYRLRFRLDELMRGVETRRATEQPRD